MIAHQADKQGYFVGAIAAPLNPAAQRRGETGQDAHLLPAGATWEPPPEIPEGYRARLVADSWELEEIPEPEPPPEPPPEPAPPIAWGEFFKQLGLLFAAPMDAIAQHSPHLHGLLLLSWNRRATPDDAEDGRQLWNALLTEPAHAAIATDIRAAFDGDPAPIAAAEQAIADLQIPWQIQPDRTIASIQT